MDKAKVTAYKINTDGTRGEVLASTTSNQGEYQLTYDFASYGGAVWVVVESTADTTMLDEATGQSLPAQGLTLEAAIQPPSSASAASVTVQVNPFTSTAVREAVTTGGLTVARIEQANKNLRETLGFDPLVVKPEFNADNKPTNQAAAALAAVSRLAKDGAVEGCDSGTATAKITCVVEKLAEKPLWQSPLAASLQATIDVVAQEANVIPPKIDVPTGAPAEEGAVAQAKVLMGTLRSNAKALDAADLSLQTELTKVNDEISGGVFPVVDSTMEMLRTALFGINLLKEAQAGSEKYELLRPNALYTAGCSVLNAEGRSATTPEEAVRVGCSSYQIRNVNQDDGFTGTTATWRWRHRLLIGPAENGAYEMRSTVRREYQERLNNAWVNTFDGTENSGRPKNADGSARTDYSVRRGDEGVATLLLGQKNTRGDVSSLQVSGTIAPSLVYRGLGANVVSDR